jgi:phage gpG-like protein
MLTIKTNIKKLISELDTFVKAITVSPRLFRKLGALGVWSIVRNFEVGGRPEKWKPSKRVLEEGGDTLVKSGRLKRSIEYDIRNFKVYVGVFFGPALLYGRIHNFGLTVRLPHAVIKMPKREFLIIPPEDHEKYIAILWQELKHLW